MKNHGQMCGDDWTHMRRIDVHASWAFSMDHPSPFSSGEVWLRLERSHDAQYLAHWPANDNGEWELISVDLRDSGDVGWFVTKTLSGEIWSP